MLWPRREKNGLKSLESIILEPTITSILLPIRRNFNLVTSLRLGSFGSSNKCRRLLWIKMLQLNSLMAEITGGVTMCLFWNRFTISVGTIRLSRSTVTPILMINAHGQISLEENKGKCDPLRTRKDYSVITTTRMIRFLRGTQHLLFLRGETW
jgi:hypothetical protein